MNDTSLEDQLNELREAGHITDDDRRNPDGSPRTMEAMVSAGRARAVAGSSGSNNSAVISHEESNIALSSVPEDLKPFLADASELRTKSGARPTKEQLIELGTLRRATASINRLVDDLRSQKPRASDFVTRLENAKSVDERAAILAEYGSSESTGDASGSPRKGTSASASIIATRLENAKSADERAAILAEYGSSESAGDASGSPRKGTSASASSIATRLENAKSADERAVILAEADAF